MFVLHGVECEMANSMIVTLNGRARRSTITMADDLGHRTTWVCTAARPIVGPVHFSDGKRSFTIEYGPQ